MKYIIKKIITVVLLCFCSLVSADDTEIISSPSNANILFVMDLSGSMGWGKERESTPSATDPARVDVLRGAFQAIIANPDFDDMNFGLSVFSGGAQNNLGASVAHGITYPISKLTANAQSSLSRTGYTHPGASPHQSYMPNAETTDTTREYLSLLSSSTTGIWEVGGSTPMVDALFEAAQYFRGEEVKLGRFTPKDIRSAHPSTYAGNPIAEVVSSSTPSCNESSRESCNSGSCGSSEVCTSSYEADTRSDSTGGTNCSANTGQTCGTYSDSCGLGTNCVSENETVNRYCNSDISSVSDCQDANPSWSSCSTYETTSCETNSEGQSVCRDITRVKCEEEVSKTTCDANDTYTCDFPVENCTKCPDDVEETGVVGTAIYKSPIVNRCSNNGIILLTDGEPTENTSASLISNMIGSSYSNNCESVAGGGISQYGRCGPELAKFLATEDQVDGTTSTTDIEGIQTITTHIVGLALDEESDTAKYLNDITDSSGGSFLIADDTAKLILAFENLVNEIAGKARSFAAPSYSVDTSTLLSHGNSVYVPMFDKKGAVWPGNLKKFQLVDGELKDLLGNSATDADGSILSSAQDMWSDPAILSTDSVTSGGAANKINPATRLSGKMKTNVGGALVSLSNANRDDFGAGTTSTEKAELLDYISGKNSDGSARNHMGDIIHSKPVQLEISDTSGTQKVIFVGTNEGFLHAINDTDGSEFFAFMPNELIKNIKPQFNNTIQESHIYGVDSPITLWIDESSNTGYSKGNGVLDVDDGEKAYLFFGLRRGGKGYYALDVTDPVNPVLAWSAEFGNGNSWSQPIVKMLQTNKDDPAKPVLIFGGGYIDDNNEDEILDKSNAIYIVDALNGSVEWSKDITSAYSIPSKIRVLDVDNNGSVDRLYFGDTGGNIWRVDLDAGKTDITNPAPYDLTKAELHKLADLGGSDVVKRKFFEEPSVALFKDNGKPVITIAIGSGDRTSPLSEDVEDKFFVLYDKEVFAPPSNSNAIVIGDLNKSTTGFNSSSDAFNGWYTDLTSSIGEKVLSTATIYQNKIFFTTFGQTTPDPLDDNSNCLESNEARFYILDLKTGDEYLNTQASTGEILGTPQLIFPSINASNCTEGNCERPPVKACAGYCGPGRPPIVVDGIGGSPLIKSLGRVYWIDK